MLRDNEILTGVVRLSYANIWEPKAPMNGGKPVYSASLIISKDDDKTIGAIKSKIKALLQDPKVIQKLGGPSRPTAKVSASRSEMGTKTGHRMRPMQTASLSTAKRRKPIRQKSSTATGMRFWTKPKCSPDVMSGQSSSFMATAIPATSASALDWWLFRSGRTAKPWAASAFPLPTLTMDSLTAPRTTLPLMMTFSKEVKNETAGSSPCLKRQSGNQHLLPFARRLHFQGAFNTAPLCTR